ncbi:muscle-specific protein 20 isoform X2 [Lingula anatina]|uniref:Calponin n=1 Tax=Lingula anatina TaxID=7574 RepID=A0A1S3IZR5_LINAN|nr:muscle-specific protein 20 isoform X2 [Lingula anatina]|eukprot:XP_013403491.1 muscle-specific protein 20 isoform X2 [Lingula anatina]
MSSDSRAKPAGIARDIANKIAGKRDAELEQAALDWIGAVTGQAVPSGAFEDVLRDGVVLCNLINALKPGSVKKVNKSGGAFLLMANLEQFTQACVDYGCRKEDLFQSVDLWEKRNIPAVTNALQALGTCCQRHPEYKGPIFGPKPAEKNVRQFTDEQMRAGQTIIGLQMGSNQGASQSGMNIGNTRHIVD